MSTKSIITSADNIGEHPKLSPEQLAERLRISPRTLANWRYQRKGPPFYKIGHRIEYDLIDLERWEAAQRVETGGRHHGR